MNKKSSFNFQVTSSAEIVQASPDLDEFTCNLSSEDARVLVDLLKLAVAVRAGHGGREALAHVLTALGKTYPQVSGKIHKKNSFLI